MKDIEEIKRIRDLFEKGAIKQEDIELDMQFAIADLYKSEIEAIRDDIYNTKKDIALYNTMINNVDEMQKLLEGINNQE